MFTGIIEQTGIIRSCDRSHEGGRLTIGGGAIGQTLAVGDSVAVNGVCLTAARCEGEQFTCDLSGETLTRTSLGRLQPGRAVNLERPLAVGDRLGGHFVLGHIDGVGTVLSTPAGGSSGGTFEVGYPKELERYLVHKGSIAVDGISLTLAFLHTGRFGLAIIPHTFSATNLRFLQPGDPVNLEVDVLGKYIEKLIQAGSERPDPSRITLDYLKERGY